MTTTHKILEAYATGNPMTQVEVEEASGIYAHSVGMYIKRLKDYGDIERVVCGCKCVKYRITSQGRMRLQNPRPRGGMPRSRGLLLSIPRVNSVFALGGM